MIKEIGKRFIAARSQLKYWKEQEQRAWQDPLVTHANAWRARQKEVFGQLVSNTEALATRVASLEKATVGGYKIDFEMDVVMEVAPPLPLSGLDDYAHKLETFLERPDNRAK